MLRRVLLVVLASLLTVPAFAGEGHNHEAAVEPAPHGGILRDSPPYKVELVLNGDHAKIYVYDSALQPVKKESLAATAKGELAFPKEKPQEVVFNYGEDGYEATVKGISTVYRFDMHVKLMIDQKEIIGDFGIDNIH